jgi:hypothetical protein
MVEIEARVWVELNEIIDNDFEGFLDILSEGAVGTVLLQNIAYHPIGLSDLGNIEFRVKGELDPNMFGEDELKEAIEYAAATSRPL